MIGKSAMSIPRRRLQTETRSSAAASPRCVILMLSRKWRSTVLMLDAHSAIRRHRG